MIIGFMGPVQPVPLDSNTVTLLTPDLHEHGNRNGALQLRPWVLCKAPSNSKLLSGRKSSAEAIRAMLQHNHPQMMTSLVLTGQTPHLLGIAGESQQLRCWLPTLHWHVSDDIWHKVVPQHCQRP